MVDEEGEDAFGKRAGGYKLGDALGDDGLRFTTPVDEFWAVIL